MLKEGVEVTISFILLLATTTYGGFSVGQYIGQQNSFKSVFPSKVSTTEPNKQIIVNSQGELLTLESVATHNTPTDCWIIISGKVYSVSSYLSQHPGGAFRITPYCGQDATQAFATQGGQGTHSSGAQADLAQLLLGSVDSVTSTTSLNPQVQTPSTRGNDEEEYEDD